MQQSQTRIGFVGTGDVLRCDGDPDTYGFDDRVSHGYLLSPWSLTTECDSRVGYLAPFVKTWQLPDVILNQQLASSIDAGLYGEIPLSASGYGADLLTTANQILSSGGARSPSDFRLISQFDNARNVLTHRAGTIAAQYAQAVAAACREYVSRLAPIQWIFQQQEDALKPPVASDNGSESLFFDTSVPFSLSDMGGTWETPSHARCGSGHRCVGGFQSEDQTFVCSECGSVIGPEVWREICELTFSPLQKLKSLAKDYERITLALRAFSEAVGLLIKEQCVPVPSTIVTSQRAFFTHHGAHPPDSEQFHCGSFSGGVEQASH